MVSLLEPLNVLPRYAEQLCNLGHTHKVRSDLEQLCPRDCLLHGRERADDRIFRRIFRAIVDWGAVNSNERYAITSEIEPDQPASQLELLPQLKRNQRRHW